MGPWAPLGELATRHFCLNCSCLVLLENIAELLELPQFGAAAEETWDPVSYFNGFIEQGSCSSTPLLLLWCWVLSSPTQSSGRGSFLVLRVSNFKGCNWAIWTRLFHQIIFGQVYEWWSFRRWQCSLTQDWSRSPTGSPCCYADDQMLHDSALPGSQPESSFWRLLDFIMRRCQDLRINSSTWRWATYCFIILLNVLGH